MKFIYPEGATPFNQDDIHSLIPFHITTQSQLNEWEQLNIQRAELWLFSRKRRNLLTLEFVKALHKRMFDQTWKWAGSFRKVHTNIGVAPAHIHFELINLLDDTKFQIQNSVYPIEEIAVRFHHRLVKIHPFANGNGRHARLMADAFLYNNGRKRFTWGSADLTNETDVRKRYITALKAADEHNYLPLIEFVKC